MVSSSNKQSRQISRKDAKYLIMSFNHVPVELPEIKATTKDKVRLYETPDGNFYQSITTVLSVRNKKGLLVEASKAEDIASEPRRTELPNDC